MRLSKEQFEERKAIVRQIMVRNPGSMSSRRLQELLKEQDQSWSLEHCWKMLNIVIAERTQDIDASLAQEVTIMEDTIIELAKECWAIIKNKDVRDVFDKNGDVVGVVPAVTDDVKLRAIDTLTRNMKMMLDVKFDAGIFKKKLGEMEIKTFSVFVDLVKQSAQSHDHQPATTETGGNQPSDPQLPAATE